MGKGRFATFVEGGVSPHIRDVSKVALVSTADKHADDTIVGVTDNRPESLGAEKVPPLLLQE